MSDKGFARRLAASDRRQDAFLRRLQVFDQRDAALIRRLKQLGDRLGVVVRQTRPGSPTTVQNSARTRTQASSGETPLEAGSEAVVQVSAGARRTPKLTGTAGQPRSDAGRERHGAR